MGVFPSDDTALKAELDITGFQKAVNSISPVDMDSFEVHMNNSGIKESYLNSLGYNKTQYEGYDFVGYKRYISVEVDGVKQYKEVPLDTPLNNLLVGNYIVGVYQKFVLYGKMNPIEVLKIATQNNAKLLGIETKCGCIKEGFTADIIILSENPLENIKNLENIDMVFKRGRLVKKKKVKKYHEIDSLLCEILPR